MTEPYDGRKGKRSKRSVLPPTADESLLALESRLKLLEGEIAFVNDRIDRMIPYINMMKI